MKVTLISHTPDPLETLVYTKGTRLQMDAKGFAAIKAMSREELLAEWEYMKKTIQSSWEFLEFIFQIQGVSRAFTHQLVRHRIGTKFAQQSQRTVDMSGFNFIMPKSGQRMDVDLEVDGPHGSPREVYLVAQEEINNRYRQLIEMEVLPEDARSILPTNVSTNITFGCSLRTLHNMGLLRLCTKAQGEFQEVFRALRAAVAEKLPWAAEVIQVQCCWTGTCAFPSFPTEDCHVKPYVYDPTSGKSYNGKVPMPLPFLRNRHMEIMP